MLITLERGETLPVSLEDAKQHLRVDHDDDDTLIERALKAGIEYVERHTGLALQPTTFQYRVDEWPCEPVSLPRAPVREVQSVKYLDEDGIEQTVATDQYAFDRDPAGALVTFVDDFDGPDLRANRYGAVRITFTAGFDDPNSSGSGDDPSLVLPEMLKICVLMLTSHWYEQREAVSFQESHPVVLSTRSILDQNRIYR